jgi:hypothetical protein
MPYPPPRHLTVCYGAPYGTCAVPLGQLLSRIAEMGGFAGAAVVTDPLWRLGSVAWS